MDRTTTTPRLLREAGLVDLAADVCFPFTSPASDRLEAATVRQIRTELNIAVVTDPAKLASMELPTPE